MKIRCEIYLAMNEDGDFEVSTDSDSDATERLVENSGGAMVRVVKLTVAVTPPAMIEAEMDVADEAGTTAEIEPTA